MNAAADKYRYEYMRLEAIRGVLERCPVAIQPSGLLEWHGEHNAIGLDGLKAYNICERAIQLLGDGALFPVNWVGTYGFIRYPGTICYDNWTTFQVFMQLFEQQIKIGFKVIVVLTGHYGEHQMKELIRARDRADIEAKEKGLNVKIMTLREFDLVPHIFNGDHAQQYETSMLWRVGQDWGVDLVDVSGCHEGVEIVPRYQIDDDNIPIHEPEEWMWSKELLNPEKCSAEYGEFLISRIAAGLASEILEIMHEQGLAYEPPSPIPDQM